MKLTLNVRRLVADLGGPSIAARYLSSHGFEVEIKTVSSWQVRNSIPMEAWVSICGVVLKDTGKFPELRKYFDVEK